jgi:nitroreductase
MPEESIRRPTLDMPLEDAIRTQRSIRRLKPDSVPDELVLHLIELGLQAPTGGNRQNVAFVVVRDAETKRGMARFNRAAWALYGPIARRAEREDAAAQRMFDAVQWQADHYEEIPVLIVACVKWVRRGVVVSGVPLPVPFLANIYYGSVFPAVQNILLGARAAELGASLTVMPLWFGPGVRRLLGLPLTVTPVAVIPLGWPRGRYGAKRRRRVGEVVHLDRWGNQPFAR